MLSRKSAALSQLEENEEVLAIASNARVSELEDEVREADLCDRIHKSALNVTLMKHGECFLLCIQLPPKQLLQSNSQIMPRLQGWSIKNNSSHITYRLNDGTGKLVYKEVFYQHGRMKETKCPEWDAYYRMQACSLEVKPCRRKMRTIVQRVDLIHCK